MKKHSKPVLEMFFDLVVDMRQKQKAYNTDWSRDNLGMVSIAEAAVDEAIKKIRKEDSVATCEWTPDDFPDAGNSWTTSCRQAWEFNNEENPIENEMLYCPFCGRTLVPVPIVSDEDEE